ncbi:hypothetical protein ACFLYO_00860 [Chloroflexota bacterium]
MSDTATEYCPVCRVGRLQLRATTYSRVTNGLLISVPDTLQWQCDYCRHTAYDWQMMLRIEATIGQVGPPHNYSRQRTHNITRAKTQLPNNYH